MLFTPALIVGIRGTLRANQRMPEARRFLPRSFVRLRRRRREQREGVDRRNLRRHSRILLYGDVDWVFCLVFPFSSSPRGGREKRLCCQLLLTFSCESALNAATYALGFCLIQFTGLDSICGSTVLVGCICGFNGISILFIFCL